MNVDYDIHGILGLRLIDPTPSLARLVARQLDPWRPAPLASAPDVSISRSVAPTSRGNRYRLGDAGDSQECEFNDSEFILRKGGMSVSIPFASIGDGCVIGWSGRGGMRRLMIDYVRPALQISLLPKDRLAVHSAAVSYEGRGILLSGWAESGKTEAMLGFLQAGAAFVSDKWTIVDGDGSSIRHFPTPITVRNWMIDLIPGLRARLKGAELLRARAAALMTSVLETEALSRAPLPAGVKGLAELAGRVSVTPSQLLGKDGDGGGRWQSTPSAPLESLFLLVTSGEDRIAVREADTDEVAARLADCAAYERRAFFGLYQRFKYAFPGRRNSLIEDAREAESGMLAKALASKRVFVVEVPFPFDPSALFRAIQPFC
jgi:hypothetical protein